MQDITKLRLFCCFYSKKIDLPRSNVYNVVRFRHKRSNQNSLNPLKVTPLPRKQPYRNGEMQDQVKSGRFSGPNKLVSINEDENDDFSRVSDVISRYSSKMNAVASEQEFERGVLKTILAGRAKTIEAKYFRKKSQPLLLTWTAKEQIRFLHKEDPEEWSRERLVASFPVSAEIIKKILKSKVRLHRYVDIIQHDKEVSKNWADLKLSLEDGNVSALDDELLREFMNVEKESLIPNAVGFKHISLLNKTSDSFKVNGPFSEIVKDCYDVKQASIEAEKKKLRDQSHELAVILSDVSKLFKNLQNPRNVMSRFKKHTDEAEKDIETTSQEPQFPPLFIEDTSKQPEQINENSSPHSDLFITQKYKDDPFTDQKDNYVRRKSLKVEVAEKVEVEKDRTEKTLYVSGDNVYDEHGEFLYRIP